MKKLTANDPETRSADVLASNITWTRSSVTSCSTTSPRRPIASLASWLTTHLADHELRKLAWSTAALLAGVARDQQDEVSP